MYKNKTGGVNRWIKEHVDMILQNQKCIELHTSHNLWIRKSKTDGYFIRECFPVNSVPNKNANYEVILK